jgi:hypothetical protein
MVMVLTAMHLQCTYMTLVVKSHFLKLKNFLFDPSR